MGDTAVVGAPASDDVAGGGGAVYVYTRVGSTWSVQAKLHAPASPLGGFGGSVALDGDLLAVGSSASHGSSTVYIYHREGAQWEYIHALKDPSQTSYGGTIAIRGHEVFIGRMNDPARSLAHFRFVPAAPPGHRVSGGMVERCHDGGYQPAAGQPLCIIADQGFIVSNDGEPHTTQSSCGTMASTAGPGGYACDMAGVFSATPRGPARARPAVLPGQTMEPDPPATGYKMGSAIAVQGDVMVMGMPDASGEGEVVVYRRAGDVWGEATRLIAGTVEAGGQHGYDVAIDGAVIAVSSYHQNIAGKTNAGAVYIYDQQGGDWSTVATMAPTHTITEATTHVNGDFGRQIAMDSGHLAVLAPSTQTAAMYDIAHGVVPSLVNTIDSCPCFTGGEMTFIAVNGNTLAITNNNSGGRVAIFRYTSTMSPAWTHHECHAPPPASVDLGGGFAVPAISQDLLALLTRDMDGIGPATGVVQVYRRVDQTSPFIHEADVPLPVDARGVTISPYRALKVQSGPGGDFILVGDTHRQYSGDYAAAYLFHSAPSSPAWSVAATMRHPDPKGSHGSFGLVLDMDGDTIAVAAVNDEVSGFTSAGRVFMYTKFLTEATPGYAVDDGLITEMCSNGHYQPLVNGAHCVESTSGSHVPNDGKPHAAQIPCDNGQFQPGPQSSFCIDSLPGGYVPADGMGHPVPEACEPGTYQPLTGQKQCWVAAPGRISTDRETEVMCDAGTYQPESGRDECRPADVNYYVPTGGAQASQRVCPVDQHPNPAQTGCVAGPPTPFAFTPTLTLGGITPPTRLPAADGLGWAVAMAGDTMVVGGYQADVALVYTRVDPVSPWGMAATLAPTAPVTDFGVSVAISGATIVVGGKGQATVFIRPADGWGGAVFMPQAITTANTDTTGDASTLFGRAVAVEGNTLVVTHPGDTTGSAAGAVVVFTRSASNLAFIHSQTLRPSWASANDMIGYSMALSGDLIVAGSHVGTTAAGTTGSAGVWRRPDPGSAFIEEGPLTPPDLPSADSYGFRVAASGDTVAVSSTWGEVVYVFIYDGVQWLEQARLKPTFIQANSEFGSGLALDGDRLIIGTPYFTDGGSTEVGLVQVFRRVGSTWAVAATHSGTTVDRLGFAVAVSGTTIAATRFDGVTMFTDLPDTAGYRVLDGGVTKPCGTGTYQNASNQPFCMQCGGGEFVAGPGPAAVCTKAGLGKFIPADGLIHTADGAACTPGTFADETGLTACHPCGPSMWQDEPGMPSCKDAEAGYYVDNADRTMRVKCLGGHYAPAMATACSPTPKGTFIPNDGGLHDSIIVAEPCPPGTFANETGLAACYESTPGHHAAGAGMTGQAVCDGGGWQDGYRQATCRSTTPGHYTADDGLPHVVETVCGVGRWQNETGQASCIIAEAGYHVDPADKTRQQVCDAGTYQDAPGSEGCKDAIMGSSVPADGQPHTGVGICEPGTFAAADGMSSCTPAQAGYFSVSRIGQSPCHDGHYQGAIGMDHCLVADAGFHVPRDHAPHLAHIPCDPGSFTNETGLAACYMADAGYHVTGPRGAGQTPCNNGTYQNMPGQAGCVGVEAGYHANDTGAHTAQKPCNDGKYQDVAGQAGCKACPTNFVTPAGDLGYTECIRFISDTPIVAPEAPLTVSQTKPVTTASFGAGHVPGSAVVAVVDRTVFIVPVVDPTPTPSNLGVIPAATYPFTITYTDWSTYNGSVAVPAPYTIPRPSLVLSGAGITAHVKSSVCPASMPIDGATTALDTVEIIDGNVTCVSHAQAVTAAAVIAKHAPKIDKTDVSGDDEICVRLDGLKVTSLTGITVQLNNAPQTGVSMKNGAVCTAFSFVEDNSVASDVVLNSWSFQIYLDGGLLFSTTLTLNGDGMPVYVYVLVGLAVIPLMVMAFCAICCPVVLINVAVAAVGSMKVAVSRRSARKKLYVQKLKNVEEKMEEGVNYDEEDQDNDDDGRSPLSDDDVTLVEADLSGDDAFGDTGLNIQDLGDEELGADDEAATEEEGSS